MWVERRGATSRTILHALFIPFCWLDAEEPRKDSEALWDSRATRRQKTRFLIITSQKLIRHYVVRNELHCIKLLRFGACYSIWPSLTNTLRSLADCWFGLWISRESSPFCVRARDCWPLICYRQSKADDIFVKSESQLLAFPSTLLCGPKS